MKKTSLLLSFILLLTLISGCQSDLGVRRTTKEDWLRSKMANPLIGMGMSYRVKNFLTEQSLWDEYNKNHSNFLKELNQDFNNTQNQDTLLALIELTYLEAKNKRGIDALFYYLSCATYTSLYFQSKELKPKPTPFSPRFIYVCRFYNYATAEILEILQKEKYKLNKFNDFPIIQGKINLKPANSNLPLPFDEYDKFLICSNYLPYGFLTSSRTFGMGVPLIAIPDVNYNIKNASKIDKGVFAIYDSPVPATAFLRILQKGEKIYNGCLEFYNPYKVDSLLINNTVAPLEVDITTPLAYLTKDGSAYSGFAALANFKNMKIKEGLYFISPFDKDKIPLVIVHGLMSEPRTWMQMVNTLMDNKTIRENYQVWFFAYPTGIPVLLSSHKLRSALKKTKEKFDPKGNNPNFNKMVIIGHSMGGLLTRSMVQNSKNDIEKLVFSKPIKDLDVTPETRKMLSDSLIFKPLPFVNKTIFMATPHRGSALTDWGIMKLAVKVITLPIKIVTNLKDIAKSSALKKDIIPGKNFADIQGVDGLDEKNKVMNYLVDVPISVKYHTIMGNEDVAGKIGGTDGIVTYRSAHLNGAESELIIKSGHNVQKKASAIVEVKRILLNHLKK